MAPRFSIFVFSLLLIGVFVQAHESEPSHEKKFKKYEKSEKHEKPEKYVKPEESEKSEKPEESEKSEKPEESEKSEKPEESEKSEKPEESEKPEKSKKPEKSEKYEKSEKSKKSEKDEKSKKPEKSKKDHKSEKYEKDEKSEKPKKSEKDEESKKSKKSKKDHKSEKDEKDEKSEKPKKYEKSKKSEKPEKNEKSEKPEKNEKSEKSEKLVTFSYEGSHGPKKWGSLSPNYAACSKGKSQSPIEIVKDEAKSSKKLKPLDRNYSAANATLINNGFNIGVHFGKSSGGVAKIDGKNYKLKQMDWHCPSEHTIDGEQYAAELHLHHEADDGSLAVIATLLKLGDPNPQLKKIEEKLGELAKEKCGSEEEAHIALGEVDLKDIMKKIPKYYRYIGSLTTPPCTEKVLWSIHAKARTISKKQLEALKKPLDSKYKNNARPTQPLYGRKIELYDHSGED